MKTLSVLSVVIGFFSGSLAIAAPSSYWMKGPCGEDVKKYCADSAAGEVMKCLRAHEKNTAQPLSDSCKQKFAEKRGEGDAADAKSAQKSDAKPAQKK